MAPSCFVFHPPIGLAVMYASRANNTLKAPTTTTTTTNRHHLGSCRNTITTSTTTAAIKMERENSSRANAGASTIATNSTSGMDQENVAPPAPPRRGLADITNKRNDNGINVQKKPTATTTTTTTTTTTARSAFSTIPSKSIVHPLARRPAVPPSTTTTTTTTKTTNTATPDSDAMDLAEDMDEIDMSVDEGSITSQIGGMQIANVK